VCNFSLTKRWEHTQAGSSLPYQSSEDRQNLFVGGGTPCLTSWDSSCDDDDDDDDDDDAVQL
jgi:hypothetical protein